MANVPAYSTDRVAQTAVMMLLNLSSEMGKQIRALEKYGFEHVGTWSKEAASRIYNGSDVFYIYDVPYRLVRSKGKSSAVIGDRAVFLTYKDDGEDAIRYLYKKTDKDLLAKAEYYMNRHLPFLRDYGYDLTPELKCRVMTSKWGVCYTKKNRITISSYLFHYPLECLEYIIVHEMTHFIVPNHSKRFYELVAGRMPDYKNAQKRLKE